MAKAETVAKIRLEMGTGSSDAAIKQTTKEVEALTAALVKAHAVAKANPATAALQAKSGGFVPKRFLISDKTSDILADFNQKQVAYMAGQLDIRYASPNKLSPESKARNYLRTYNNQQKMVAQEAMFGSYNSVVESVRKQNFVGKQLRKQEQAQWAEEMGIGPRKPSISQNLMGTVFSSRSMNMLSALGDGNVMPAIQSIGASGFGMLRSMAAGSFGTGSSPLRALFGGGATAANQETSGEVGAAADPDVEGTMSKFKSEIEAVLGPLGKFAGLAVGLVAGVATVIAGSVLLASAMNANAANYRLGLQTSIGGVGGLGRASARDTWDVVMSKGHQYQYAPSVAFNTAKILGENGVYGLHGAAGMGHAMDTTLAFARQANLDPTQVAPLVGKLMQGGGRDALLVDKMFQTLQVAAAKANIPLARLVDSFKTLEETTNGSGISLLGVASLAKDQNAVGMGMNIGSAVAPLMSATGSNAFAMAAMLTGGNMKQFMQAQGDPGKLLNLVGRFARQSHTGTREGDEQMAIILAQTSGVNLSNASRKSQIKIADLMRSNYDFSAHPEELKKLLSSNQNDTKAKDLAGNLVNIKDKAVLDFQYKLDEIANHGFPDLVHSVNWTKTAEDLLAGAANAAAAALDRVNTAADGILSWLGYKQPGSGVNKPDTNPTNLDVLKKYNGAEITFNAPLSSGGTKAEHLGKALSASILMSANAVGMDYGKLVAQGYQESNFGTLTGSRGDYAQFDKNARDAYNSYANSPRNNKNFFDVGNVHYKNRFYGQDYNPKDNAQGAAAMAWYDWVKSGKVNRKSGKWSEMDSGDVVSKNPIQDQIAALRHYRGGSAYEDSMYTGYITDQASHNVSLTVEIIPTPHHTAKVTVTKPPKGGRDHHTPPSHRPVAQPKRHT